MKNANFIKAMAMAATVISIMTFASCKKDEPSNTNALKLSAEKVEVAPKATATVTISNGTAPFTVSLSDANVATAVVKDKTVTITGVAEGAAFVRVTDKAGQTGKISVTVKVKESPKP